MAALRGARCIGPAQMRGSRNADPGTEKPRWSAERRPRSPKESAANGRTGAPLGAPSPQAFCLGEKRQDGVPGAAKNTGDDARLHESWLFEN
jgi:hypothetical protein